MDASQTRIRVDLAVYDHVHNLQLVAVIKNLSGVSYSWVARYRSTLLAHGAIPPTHPLLLAGAA